MPSTRSAADADADEVSGPAQLAALVRVVATAARRGDPLVLAGALDDVAAAAVSWGAQVRRYAAEAVSEDPFDTPPENAVDGRSRHARATVAAHRGRSGRAAQPRRADLGSGEAVRARIVA